MRPQCLPIRRFNYSTPRCIQRRSLLTLAIETSCDDTSVAVLEKHKNNTATLHFHSKITSDNRSYGGVHPIAAAESHHKNLSSLVNEALRSLPIQRSATAHLGNALLVKGQHGIEMRKKPDFVTVTRGPGMRASLITGVDTAKGLAVAWQAPLLGVNHMQAHALTPRLVSALNAADGKEDVTWKADPEFPFLTLLVSGGHTMLVRSKSLYHHEILANTTDMAIGDAIDKWARDILPLSILSSANDVMYGPILESFAFPEKPPNYVSGSSRSNPLNTTNKAYSWSIPSPYSDPGPKGVFKHAHVFSYSGIGSTVKRIINRFPEMDEIERRALAQESMRVGFEHLASRVIYALQKGEVEDVNTLVVSGGVASNQYLKHVLRNALDQKGYENIRLVFPPPKFCTDNAAMIAWTGIEMLEAGWRTQLDAMAMKKWSIDPKAEDGGILGVDGWEREVDQ